jgi:hypothetical protein
MRLTSNIPPHVDLGMMTISTVNDGTTKATACMNLDQPTFDLGPK